MDKLTLFLIAGLLLIAACAPKATEGPVPAPTTGEACTTKECFFAAANACKEARLSLTEEAGTFTYRVSAGCTFTKTLDTPDPSETQELQKLLKGASMTCSYTQGKFDSRLVNSLVFGIEKCQGRLREILAQLAVFA